MRVIKSFSLVVLAGIVALGLTIPSARAALIELDLFGAGDKLITLDDVTGLEWLDLTSTRGLSYNQAEASAFVTVNGFRHANISDVGRLFTNAGIVDQSGTAHVGNLNPVIDLLNKFGCTGQCPGSGLTLPFGMGWAADPGIGTFSIARPEYQDQGGTAAAKIGTSRFDGELSYFGVGNWMVRGTDVTTVPLPAALPLLGSALSLLGFLAWRRKRNLAA